MENELIGIPKQYKSKYQDDIDKFNFRLKKLKQKYEEIFAKFELSMEDNPKEALIDVNKKMSNSTNVMVNSVKVMREINSRDNNTATVLENHTGKIIDTIGHLNKMENVVNRSEKIVKGLLYRIQSNRILLIIIIILLFLITIMVIIIKIKRFIGILGYK